MFSSAIFALLSVASASPTLGRLEVVECFSRGGCSINEYTGVWNVVPNAGSRCASLTYNVVGSGRKMELSETCTSFSQQSSIKKIVGTDSGSGKLYLTAQEEGVKPVSVETIVTRLWKRTVNGKYVVVAISVKDCWDMRSQHLCR